MPRREAPVDPDAGPVQRFAHELRQLRRQAGSPTYRAMSDQVGYGASTLSQAASGKQLPSLPVTLAYVRACGADPEEWRKRWREAAAQDDTRQPDTDAAQSPYRGLARFEPDDADLFFGRARLVGQLEELAHRRRFTAVFGPSGSGKSSLLRAGLIPRLTAQRPASRPRPAAVRVLTPGPRPMDTHGERLTPAAGAGDTWLVVDQFEELYTLCQDAEQRTAFLDALLAARRPDSRLRVVVAVRADFLGRCTEHADLTAALQDASLLIGPMSRDELREVIVKPAAARGLVVERALTARVLAEARGEPGALPLVSHAMLETWRHRRGRTLTESAYEAAGGLGGAIARTAEQVYDTFTPAEAEHARRVLLRLVNPGDGTPDTRRPASRAELDLGDPGCTATVVERLVRARLLTLDDDEVTLAHEALITAWPRLRGWVEAERERLRVHRELTEAARVWQQLGRDTGALYRGSRLASAREAFPERDRARELTPLEQSFLTASVQRRRRARLLRRTVTAVLAALVLLTSGTAVVAFQQRATARAERNAAIFNQLTSQADGLRETQPSLAAQLDLAAYRRKQTPDLRTRLLSDANTTLATTLTPHHGTVTATAFTPDGRVLATGSHDDTVRLWHVADPRRPRPLGTPITLPGAVLTVAFRPDGHVLAVGGRDHTVRLYDVSTPSRPRPLGRPLTGHTDGVVTVAFSPDGRTLASAGNDGTLRLWHVADPRHPRPLGRPTRADTDSVRQLAFSPNGRTLATGGNDHRVRLWHVADPKRPRRLATLTAHTEAVYALAFSPDGRTLVTGGYDERVRLWNVTDPRRPRPLADPLTAHTEAVYAAAFSPDGRTLATAAHDDTVRLWNVANPAYPLPLGPPLTGHTAGVWTVAFSPDGRTLATGGDDETVRLWHRPATLLDDFTNPVTAVAYRPDSRLLATASTDDHLVRLWDVRRPHHPTRLPRLLAGHHAPVLAAVFSPDGHTLATGTEAGEIRLWDLTDPRRPRLLGRPLDRGAAVTDLAFHPKGTVLAVADKGDRLQLYDLADPRRPRPLGRPLTGEQGHVHAVAFSPDGRTLATGNGDNTVRLYAVSPTGRPTPLGEPLTGHRKTVTDVAFHPDGHTLASAADDRTVRLWDVADPAAARPRGEPLDGHHDGVTAVAFSPDGHTLASASGDHTVRLWDTRRPDHATPHGQPLTGHVDTVTDVAFSPDGHSLATASYDVTARLWPLDVDRAVRRVCDHTRGVLTPTVWARYVPDVDFPAPCA